jgi:hypothetical protein
VKRAALFTVVLSACTTTTTDPVRLQLHPRGSCSSPSPYEYDISCMQSLRVDVLDAGGKLLGQSCTDVSDGRWPLLQDLLKETSGLRVLSGIVAGKVRVEVRGYLAIDQAGNMTLDGQPCQALDDAQLILWGSSGVVDLAQSGLATVDIETECRPSCDCKAITGGTCGAALELGICAPAYNQLCRTTCESDHDCYDGLMLCVDRTCSPAPQTQCDQCTTDADCGTLRCVLDTDTNERFCAQACPDTPFASACPTWMSCKRLGVGSFVAAPAP